MNKHIQNAMQKMKEALSGLRAKEDSAQDEPMQDAQDAYTDTSRQSYRETVDDIRTNAEGGAKMDGYTYQDDFTTQSATRKQKERKTPTDELPTFRRRRIWPYLVLNVLAAVVLGLSLYALLQLQNDHLNDWGREGNETGGFARTVHDEVGSVVGNTLMSQSWVEMDQLPADMPIPHTFGSWPAIRQLDYMATVSTKRTEKERLEAAKTYLNENGRGDDTFSSSSVVFYTKADLQHWMKVGLKKETVPVELRFGRHTEFRTKTKGSSRRAEESSLPNGEEMLNPDNSPSYSEEDWLPNDYDERAYSADGWTQDIIEQAVEVVKPLSADSLLAAAQGNLEVYRESMRQLQNTLDFLKINPSTRYHAKEKPSNLEYTISILDGAKNFTNANRAKSKTPAWSAPLTIENGYCMVGTGLWSDKLMDGTPPISVLLAQDDSLNAPGMKITLRLDTTLQEADELQLFMQTFPLAQKVSKISTIAAVIAGIVWIVTLCVTLARTTNVHLPTVRKIEGAIPLEVVLVACCLFLWLAFGVGTEILYTIDGQAMTILRDPLRYPLWIILIPVLIVLDLVGWTLLSMLFRKARQGRFFRGSIIGGVGRALHKLYLAYQDGKGAKHRTLVKVLLFYLIMRFLFLLIAIFYANTFWVLFLLTGVTLPIAFALQQDRNDARILQSMQHIADGDWHERLDEESFHGAHRAMANQINRFDQSLQHAVDKSLKNERMQTELITNVSHDLRTPLTSIINYVDLLRSPDATEEERAQYLDVLAKKAQRLKTLMNDLIDVSKATSGAVQLNMEIIDYAEVIRQSLAEVDSGWKKRALTPVVDLPEDPLFIEADGHKLSRVLENLFSNAQKYSQDGTRVYIQLEAQDHHALFTIKNTSRYPLNMSPEELLERFNRSDKSRTTEGSGLGLSIAEQLAKRMNGRLTLDIDGDLFKASVEFPLH